MEILNEYKNGYEGNDCWINNYVCLIRLDFHLYLVTHTEIVQGNWRDNIQTTKTQVFENYDNALTCMVTLVGKLERE